MHFNPNPSSILKLKPTMKKHLSFLAAALLCGIVATPRALADVRLPEVLGDHLVLQQDSEVTLWGWACTGEPVNIETSWGVKCQVRGDAQGQWRVKIKTPHASPLDKGLHPEHITFTVPGENMAQIKDILIGEVWLCSGQSNMLMPLKPGYPEGWCAWFGESSWPEESKHAERPGLRVFNLENAGAPVPQADCKSNLSAHMMQPKDAAGLIPDLKRGWQPCTAATAPDFSAVAYYFGAALSEKLNVPVGVITCSVGGTGIKSWMCEKTLPAPATRSGRNAPSIYFNGMIAPLTPMKIKGIIWYQGESDVRMGSQYGPLFQTMITDWRKQFDSADLPFYFVQIAPFHHRLAGAAGDLRAAQASALQLKNTGMAVISDVSDVSNIHPKAKREVGRRLAFQALNKTYDCKEIAADGPVFKSAALKEGKIHIAFDHLGGGLVARDGKPLTCFEVAGADGIFAPAVAAILGDEVVVSLPAALTPRTLRFGWGEADTPNLMGKTGMPARQFQAPVQ